MDAATAAAQTTLDSLRQEEDFVMTVVAALGDDRSSFDKLETWAKDKTNRFSQTAGQVWTSIFESHSSPMSLTGFPTPWREGVDPSKFTLDQLFDIYQSAPATIKPTFLEYIYNRNDMPKQNRLDFMMKVMKSDQSLTGMEYAGRHFGQLSGQPNVKPMALDYLSSWWDKHRHEFDGK